jgi:hypothetical protein
MRNYAKYAEDDLLFADYMQKFIHGVKNHQEFVALNGGNAQLEKIKADRGKGYAVNLVRG